MYGNSAGVCYLYTCIVEADGLTSVTETPQLVRSSEI